MAGLSTKDNLRQVEPLGSYGPVLGGACMREDKGGTDECSDGHTFNYLYKTT